MFCDSNSYDAMQKFGVDSIFFMFLKECCIYLIKNTVKTVILWNIIIISMNCFLFE